MRCGEKANRVDRFFACMHFLVIWMIERIMRVQRPLDQQISSDVRTHPGPCLRFSLSLKTFIRRSKIVAEPAFPCFPSHKKFLHGDRPIMTSTLSLKPVQTSIFHATRPFIANPSSCRDRMQRNTKLKIMLRKMALTTNRVKGD